METSLLHWKYFKTGNILYEDKWGYKGTGA